MSEDGMRTAGGSRGIVRRVSLARGACTVLIVAFVAAACSGGVDAKKGNLPTSPAADATSSTAPRTYHYDGEGGVSATLRVVDSRWELSVINKTGRTLEEPSLYALDAEDGGHISATVAGASAMKDTEASDFEVSFEKSVGPDDLGLVLLLFGGENFGPLAPG